MWTDIPTARGSADHGANATLDLSPRRRETVLGHQLYYVTFQRIDLSQANVKESVSGSEWECKRARVSGSEWK